MMLASSVNWYFKLHYHFQADDFTSNMLRSKQFTLFHFMFISIAPIFRSYQFILHGGHEDEVVSKDGARAAAQHLSLCSWDWKFVCSLLKVFDNPSRTCLTYFSIDSTWLKYNNESSIIFELAISISLDSRVLTHQRQLTSFLLPITLQSFANGKRTSTHKPQSDCKREYGSNIFGGERQRQNAGGVQDSRPISQAESTFKLNGLGR